MFLPAGIAKGAYTTLEVVTVRTIVHFLLLSDFHSLSILLGGGGGWLNVQLPTSVTIGAQSFLVMVTYRGGRWTSLDASFARCFAIF